MIEAPGTSAGFVTEGGRTFESSQTRVEMNRGVAFGYDFTIEGAPIDRPWRLTHVTKHPLMKRPDGTASIKDAFVVDVPSKKGTISGRFWYTLSEDFELVPGEWTLSVLDGENVLVEKTFTVVAPTIKDTPNKSPGVTPGSVTPPAKAPGAPPSIAPQLQQ